jgi:hypothetical protein
MEMQKTPLMDSFAAIRWLGPDEKWYAAMPWDYKGRSYTLCAKLRDCIEILKGRAIAVHFKEQEEAKQ